MQSQSKLSGHFSKSYLQQMLHFLVYNGCLGNVWLFDMSLYIYPLSFEFFKTSHSTLSSGNSSCMVFRHTMHFHLLFAFIAWNMQTFDTYVHQLLYHTRENVLCSHFFVSCRLADEQCQFLPVYPHVCFCPPFILLLKILIGSRQQWSFFFTFACFRPLSALGLWLL